MMLKLMWILCFRKDRVDYSFSTACYSNWRMDRIVPAVEVMVSPIEEEGGGGVISSPRVEIAVQEGASTPFKVPPPKGYRLAKELTMNLFCGCGQVAWDRIRIPNVIGSPRGAGMDSSSLFVLELTDAVNEECVSVVDEEEGRGGVAAAVDFADMVKMIRKVPAYYGTPFAIETNE
jgi:hypothetical protein